MKSRTQKNKENSNFKFSNYSYHMESRQIDIPSYTPQDISRSQRRYSKFQMTKIPETHQINCVTSKILTDNSVKYENNRNTMPLSLAQGLIMKHRPLLFIAQEPHTAYITPCDELHTVITSRHRRNSLTSNHD